MPRHPGFRRPQPIGQPLIAPVEPGFRQRGRFGDTEIAHVSPGETLVPVEVAQQPGVRQGLSQGFRRAGINPDRFVVRSGRNSINPRTGAREFFARDIDDSPGAGRSGFDSTNDNIGQPGGQNPRDGAEGGGGGEGGFRSGTINRTIGGVGTNRPGTPVPPQDPTAGLPEDFFTQEAAFGRFRTSPGFEFRFNRGVDALDRSAARFGSLFSGNQATAITELGQNLASAEFADYYNRLAGLAGIGQSSAAQTGALTAQTTANQGNAIIAGGAAQTGGAIGVNNAIQGGISNALFQQFLDQQGAE